MSPYFEFQKFNSCCRLIHSGGGLNFNYLLFVQQKISLSSVNLQTHHWVKPKKSTFRIDEPWIEAIKHYFHKNKEHLVGRKEPDGNQVLMLINSIGDGQLEIQIRS